MGRQRVASLKVDGRHVRVRPCASSDIGHVDGLCVSASSAEDVLEAVNCLPGRVLVVTGGALDGPTIDVIAAAAERGTFHAIVVQGASPFQRKLPVPVVIIEEDAWEPSLKMPTRYVVSVYEDVDLSSLDRRRHRAHA